MSVNQSGLLRQPAGVRVVGGADYSSYQHWQSIMVSSHFNLFLFWPDSQSEHREHRGKHDDDDGWKSGSSSGLIYCGLGSEGVPVGVVVVCLDADVSLGLVISTFWLHLQLIDWWMLRFGSNKVQIKSKLSVGSFNNFSLCGVPAVIFRWDRGPVAAAAKSQTTSSHSITGLMSL